MTRTLLFGPLVLCCTIGNAQIVKNRTIIRDIRFDTGKSSIAPAEQVGLADICTAIANRDNYRIFLKGNTDSIGSFHYNLDLSIKRARTVRNALLECGAMDTTITYQGYSYMEPKASNSTATGMAYNRRTTISLTLLYFPVSALEPVRSLRPGATLDLQVLFSFNSAELKKSSLDDLLAIIRLLREYPDLEFEIRGWTAVSSTDNDLSGLRAKAVYDFLLDNDIAPERMRYEGMGGSNCSDPDLFSKCRRVEITITRNPYLTH